MMIKTLSKDRPKGFWIPWLFVGFFGVVLLVNGIMIYTAFATWNGLAAQRSYDKGITYNRNIEAQKRQTELGWSHDVEVAKNRLSVIVRRANDKPLTGAIVSARMERASDSSMDFEVTLKPTSPGLYQTEFDDIASGQWNVHLVATLSDDRWVVDEQVVMP